MRTALALALVVAFPFAVRAQPLAFKHEGVLQWVCGGVGAEERRALDALKPQSNLEVLFVTAKRGGYVADAQFALYSRSSASPLLAITADGPECLVAAPAGAYRIEGRYEGVTRTANVTIPPKTTHPARAVLAFPEEPWNGVRASEEEKRQAAQP